MRIKLVTVDCWSPPLELELEMDSRPLIIGSDRQADVVLTDAWTSPSHCEISCSDGQLIVRDLHSQVGTTVNRARVHEQTKLHAGDELGVGIRTFLVSFPPQANGAANGSRHSRSAKAKC
jgi:pSer/pThr/pTyr-binding forkhead associated (FHA) protein